MKKQNQLLWDKYLTREFSFLYITFSLECYMKENLRSQVLVNGSGPICSFYGIKEDVDCVYQRIDTFVAKNLNKVLEKIRLLDEDIKEIYSLVNEIKKENNKNEIKTYLKKFDQTYFGMLKNYLFFVYMGYGSDRKSVSNFLRKYQNEFNKTRTYTIDIDMEKEFANIYGRFDKKLGDNCRFMSRKEISDFINNKPIDFDKINKRKKEYLLIMKNGKIKEHLGLRICKKLKDELNHIKVTNTNQIKGNIVCRGKVQGKVRVVFTRNDYKKIKKDEILVTPMTKPDIEPYLHLVRGIVTNDGGALCHASIISREQNIPCIVGTKHATEIFKDGEYVEVNADKGIIKKLG